MMDHRKALTISLAVDKGDDSMIHWSRLGGNRASLQDPQQEKGAVLGDHSQGALPQCNMVTQPRLVLTDVLTTDVGRTYLHKTWHGQGAKETGRGRGARGRRAQGRPSQYSRETWRGGGEEEPGEDWRRCGVTEDGYRDGGELPGSTGTPGLLDPAAPNGLKRRASLPAVDPPTRPHQEKRKSCYQRASEEVVKMVIVGEEGVNGEEQRCRQTRDRGVSESWRSGRGKSQGGPLRGKELSPPQLIRAWDTDSGSDAEGNESRELRCNGRLQVRGRGLAGSWSSRRSVLRLSGEAQRAGPGAGAGAGPAEGSAKRLRPDGQDPSDHTGIVMLTTGMEEGAEASPGPGSGVRGRRGTVRPNPSLDRTSTPSTVEPIVLSSDDEEPSGGAQTPQSSCSSVLQPLGEPQPQGERPNPQRGNSRMRRTTPKLIRVRVPGFPALSSSRSKSSSNQALPFSDLYCGGVWAQASADATISAQRITIPLKDGRGQAHVVLQHPGLWRYSVWEQEDLTARGLAWEGPPGACSPPPTLLLLYLSNAQALCVQRQLRQLFVKSGPAPTAGEAPYH
ncbi:uncharacterized protein LOC134017170 isoform X2 [Osmerus eperlanus]|uniref:uncharacterized protein LOC134017170 isoform X2 n=1 Tax=Osmerus eperlanus TaxID=29151 RepID=UPI002E1068B1